LKLKILFPLYIGAAIGPMGGIGIVTIIPVIARLWSIEFSTASLTITFYMIPFIIAQVFSGSIAQIFDVRKAILFGFGTYSTGAILCSLSPNLLFLLGSRIIQGVGGAFLTPIIMALIGEIVPERNLGKAIGILGLAYTVGVTLGPFISGIIEIHYGWSSFFVFLSAISFITGAIYLIFHKGQKGEFKKGTRIVSIFPLLKMAIREPGVIYLSFSAFSLFIAYIGIMTFTADHLKANYNLPSDQIGTLLSFTGFSGIIISPIAGFLGDRFGRGRIFLAGSALMFLSTAIMAQIPYSYSLYLFLFLLLGAGSATSWTNLNTMAVESSLNLRRTVTSIYNAIKFSGYALSPMVLSLFYNPFGLKGVQIGCLVAITISSLLTLRSHTKRKNPIFSS
jgi:MFS family permease